MAKRLYLSDRSYIGTTPGVVVGAWDAGTVVRYALTDGSTGGSSTQVISEVTATTNWDNHFGFWISEPMQAYTFTTSDTVNWILRMNESNLSANAFTNITIWIMKPDGTNRGTILANSIGNAELPNTSIGSTSGNKTLSAVAMLTGDRIVVELGARFVNTSTTSFSVTNYVNDNAATDLTVGVNDSLRTFFEFSPNLVPMNDRYWVGGTGNFTDAAEWALTSGGAGGAGTPGGNGVAYFDASSFSAGSQVVTGQPAAAIAGVDWTGVTNNPNWTINASFSCNSKFILASAMTVTMGSTYTLSQTVNGNMDVNTFGKSLTNLTIHSRRITLLADLIIRDFSTLGSPTYGSLVTNDYDVTCRQFKLNSATTLPSTLGTSIITASGSSALIDIDLTGDNGTSVSASSADFIINSSGGTSYYFAADNQTIKSLSITGGIVDIDAAPTSELTITTLAASPGVSIGVSQVQINVTNLTMEGTSGSPIVIAANGAHDWELRKTSGQVVAKYIDISDSNAAGGAQFYATNSTDGGNNTGWIFGFPPSGAFLGFF